MNSHTSKKILDASMALFSQRGYNSVTTKQIAQEAGVSEMTVFRYFVNKRNLFEQALERFMFSPKFKALFENSLVWDLEKDLLKISYYYQDALHKNQKIILMHFKNDGLDYKPESPLFKYPNELKKLLVDYLNRMKEKGALEENPEVLAVSILAVNFGFFMTYLINKRLTKNTDLDSCISNFVKIITKGVTG